MRLLRGTKLHSGHNNKARGPARLNGGPGIAAGVVIGDGNHLKSQQSRHIHQIVRRHLVAPARRQAGVQMQIIKQSHAVSPKSAATRKAV